MGEMAYTDLRQGRQETRSTKLVPITMAQKSHATTLTGGQKTHEYKMSTKFCENLLPAHLGNVIRLTLALLEYNFLLIPSAGFAPVGTYSTHTRHPALYRSRCHAVMHACKSADFEAPFTKTAQTLRLSTGLIKSFPHNISPAECNVPTTANNSKNMSWVSLWPNPLNTSWGHSLRPRTETTSSWKKMPPVPVFLEPSKHTLHTASE